MPASAFRSLPLVLLLALLWGGGYPLIKIAVETIPPVTVSAFRALGGGLLLLAVLGRRAPLLWRSPLPPGTYVRQAMFNCILPWILVAWASRTVDSTLATVLNSLTPIFTFLITWGITRHEPATPRKFFGVMLGLAGVLVIVGVDAFTSSSRHLAAELACIAGSLCYAIGSIVGRRFDGISPLVPATGATLVAAAVLLPLAFAVEQPWQAQPSMRSMLAVVGLAVFSTAGAFLVYFRLLATIGSIATGSQAYLRIAIGVGLGVVFLGESLSASFLAGLVLVLAGVVAMTWPGQRKIPLERSP